jgi:hypothetical protein
LTTACDVRCGNDRDGSGKQNRRRRCNASRPQPSTQATDGAEHREGPNAREARARAFSVSGPLALQAHGRAAERRYQQSNDVRGVHREGEATAYRDSSGRRYNM